MSDDAAPGEDQRLTITITIDDDATYVLVPATLTNRVELELYSQTGLTVNELLTAETWPRFMIAAIVFLARRQRGEIVTWDEVADGISWDSVVERQLATTPKA